MESAELLRRTQAKADKGERDAELLALCEELMTLPALPETQQGRVAVWRAEALLGTGDYVGAVRAALDAQDLDLPTAQRRALERVAMTARNSVAGRIPMPKPALTPPPRRETPGRTATTTRRTTTRRTPTTTKRPPAPSGPVARLVAAPSPTADQIEEAAATIDTTALASASAQLRERGRPGVAVSLARTAMATQPALASSPVAIVALATSLEADGRRPEAEAALSELLLRGPDGLTTDRFLLSAALRIVTDEEITARIRARLEAGS